VKCLLSERASVALMTLGAFFWGVVLGITFYDDTWTFSSGGIFIRFVPSQSLKPNTTSGFLVFYLPTILIGGILLLVGSRNLFRKK
jgi:hypothetical protein